MSENPMIEVSNLTKRYAGRTAVAGISFSVARARSSGCSPERRGQKHDDADSFEFPAGDQRHGARGGLRCFYDSVEVRRRIGFMPENNPLYPEMRVREYLKFRARLKGLGWKKSRERVTTVMEQCSLTDVGRRIIGQLSKGYKQARRPGGRARSRTRFNYFGRTDHRASTRIKSARCGS